MMPLRKLFDEKIFLKTITVITQKASHSITGIEQYENKYIIQPLMLINNLNLQYNVIR